jgi:hypothetical protein
MEAAAHLTGDYPADWKGKRFKGATRGWAAGVTSESTRDTVQRLLLGPLGAQGTGAIPKASIVDVRMGRGIADAVDTVLVRHKSGYTSQLGFKSYEKGREKLQASRSTSSGWTKSHRRTSTAKGWHASRRAAASSM